MGSVGNFFSFVQTKTTQPKQKKARSTKPGCSSAERMMMTPSFVRSFPFCVPNPSALKRPSRNQRVFFSLLQDPLVASVHHNRFSYEGTAPFSFPHPTFFLPFFCFGRGSLRRTSALASTTPPHRLRHTSAASPFSANRFSRALVKAPRKKGSQRGGIKNAYKAGSLFISPSHSVQQEESSVLRSWGVRGNAKQGGAGRSEIKEEA